MLSQRRERAGRSLR